MTTTLDIQADRIAEFCTRWGIVELSVFGSVLRDDFREDSDIDVLIAFSADAEWDYFDWPTMQAELSPLFGGHTVDIVERRSIQNPFMRHRILTTRRVVYAA